MSQFSNAQLALLAGGQLALPAYDEQYRKVGEVIDLSDLDTVAFVAALDLLYRRLSVPVTWTGLDSASVHAALDNRYLAIPHVRNWDTTLTGDTLALPSAPLSWLDPQVFVDGLLQPSSAYTISGTALVFAAALTAAVVQVIYAEAP